MAGVGSVYLLTGFSGFWVLGIYVCRCQGNKTCECIQCKAHGELQATKISFKKQLMVRTLRSCLWSGRLSTWEASKLMTFLLFHVNFSRVDLPETASVNSSFHNQFLSTYCHFFFILSIICKKHLQELP